ncbi:MAG: hypothetical protein K8R23_05980 [Chthoniobacter sp.]|nr:hypothetical protein [Chthoniobacter sp.]
MNTSGLHSTIRTTFLIGAASLTLTGSLLAQAEEPDNAQSLLENVKRSALERQIAAKQTDLDRLSEDLAKGQKAAETMEGNITATGNLATASSGQLEKLNIQKKRLEQVLELTKMRIEAETLKADGLKMLADAQGKALAALKKRADETSVRLEVGQAELKQLTPGGEVAAEPAGKGTGKVHSPLSDMRKKLSSAETASSNAEQIAREAMRAASSKLDLANAASGKVKKKAVNVEGDLPEIGEKPLDLEEKAPDRTPQKAQPK